MICHELERSNHRRRWYCPQPPRTSHETRPIGTADDVSHPISDFCFACIGRVAFLGRIPDPLALIHGSVFPIINHSHHLSGAGLSALAPRPTSRRLETIPLTTNAPCRSTSSSRGPVLLSSLILQSRHDLAPEMAGLVRMVVILEDALQVARRERPVAGPQLGLELIGTPSRIPREELHGRGRARGGSSTEDGVGVWARERLSAPRGSPDTPQPSSAAQRALWQRGIQRRTRRAPDVAGWNWERVRRDPTTNRGGRFPGGMGQTRHRAVSRS